MSIAASRPVARGRFIVLAAIVFSAAASLAAQNVTASAPHDAGLPRSTIVMSPLNAPSGDPVADDIAITVAQSLSVVLRLTGAFTIVHADFLDPIRSYHRSVLYYLKHGARIGLFGSVRPTSSGGYRVTVEYWRAQAPSAPPKKFTKVITNVFAVFDASDQIALKVASAAAGRRLSEGTVHVKNTGRLANYAIYADGQLVARNRSRVHVLTGRRTLIVAVPGPLGDRTVETFHVDVHPGSTVTIALNPAAASGRTSGIVIGNGAAAPHAGRSAAVGTLRVTSSPSGATVLLDGRRVGKTPLALSSVRAGIHLLNLAHRYFTAAHRTVHIHNGESTAVDVKLSVNTHNPAIRKRMIAPLSTTGASLLWTAAQVGGVAEIALASSRPTSTSSFLTTRPFPAGMYPGQMLYLDSSAFFSRIGNRLAGNTMLADIGEIGSAAAAAMMTIDFAPSWLDPAAAQTGTAAPLTGGRLSTAALITFGADAVYDAISAPFAATQTNRQFLRYVATHGTLPSRSRRRPHRFIIETGGASFLRAGYRLPLVPRYLFLAATAGFGEAQSNPLRMGLSGTAALSYNPWGARTGTVRPELFVGLRATTDFSSAGLWPEFGTGNDWVGRKFDIFTRGGIAYDLVSRHWDQFFTVGTRLF